MVPHPCSTVRKRQIMQHGSLPPYQKMYAKQNTSEVHKSCTHTHTHRLRSWNRKTVTCPALVDHFPFSFVRMAVIDWWGGSLYALSFSYIIFTIVTCHSSGTFLPVTHRQPHKHINNKNIQRHTQSTMSVFGLIYNRKWLHHVMMKKYIIHLVWD